MRRILASGLAVAAVYLIAASMTFETGMLPVRPFFDGPHANPTPYRWIDPPPGEPDDVQPQPASKVVAFGPEGLLTDYLATPEPQAQLLIPEGAVHPSEGQTGVRFSLDPVDTSTYAQPPEGTSFNSNGYRLSATYVPSGEPARFVSEGSCPDPTEREAQTCPTLVLRYAYKMPGIEMYRRSGPDWSPIVGTDSPATAELYADIPEANGLFVLTGIGDLPVSEAPSKTWDFIAIGLGVLAVAIGIAVTRLQGERKRKEMIARARGKKMKKSAGKPAP